MRWKGKENGKRENKKAIERNGKVKEMRWKGRRKRKREKKKVTERNGKVK